MEMNIDLKKIIKIQSWYRGTIFRLKRLPMILYIIKKHIQTQDFLLSNKTIDGRVNSFIDEEMIVSSLVKKFGKDRIKKPKRKRMWYDILVFDYRYGWLPLNIKTTTTLTNDNIGNLALLIQTKI